MSENPLIHVLDQAADNLKAERYTVADPKELALSMQQVARELAYHMAQLGIWETDAMDAFRKHQDVGIPNFIPSSPEVLLTGTLQVFIDSADRGRDYLSAVPGRKK